MDYETGISTGPSDLVARLTTFAVANGWTLVGATTGTCISKNGIVVGLFTDSDEIFARGAIGPGSAAVAWNNQPGHSGVTVAIDCGTGPFTAYHLFAGDEDGREYLNMVVEYASGRFRHLAFGQLIKHGSYTGGTYVDGVNWNNSTTFQNSPDNSNHQVICDANMGSNGTGQVHCDYDGKTNNWQIIQGGTSTASGVGSARSEGMGQIFPNLGVQNWNLRNNLAPLTYFVNRASSLRSPIGRIPNMRIMGMNNLQPGETLSIGGVDWMCFPIVQRTEGAQPNTVETSGFYGYAYKLP